MTSPCSSTGLVFNFDTLLLGTYALRIVCLLEVLTIFIIYVPVFPSSICLALLLLACGLKWSNEEREQRYSLSFNFYSYDSYIYTLTWVQSAPATDKAYSSAYWTATEMQTSLTQCIEYHDFKVFSSSFSVSLNLVNDIVGSCSREIWNNS